MTTKRKTSKSNNVTTVRPRLIAVGKHFINPNDVSCISRVACKNESYDDELNENVTTKKILYVVRFISDPNPQYTCWVEKNDIGILLNQFDIVEE